MSERPKIFDELERVAPLIPTPVYWLDTTYKIIGANDLCLPAIGSNATIIEGLIGKTYYDYYPKDIADELTKMIKIVLQTNQAIKVEEKIVDVTTGKFRYYETARAPLYGDNGEIVGTICTAIETTDKKEAEKLILENQKYIYENETQKIKLQLEEQNKFRKVADQMAHDIGSPLMALSVLENHCAELPEAKRNMLRESIASIREIAGSLLGQYKLAEEPIEDNISNEILVYAVIEQIILEKRHEYHNLPIKFICEYEKNSRLAFIRGNSTSFKRMLSNLINNSVQAIGNKQGIISITLDCDEQFVKIIIKDNGKGMSPDIVEMISNNIPITSGKDDGHGIGYSQIHETILSCNGNLSIHSALNKSCTITLNFPKIPRPDWITEAVTINSGDTIVILDDDSSIHGAWDIKFNELLKTNPQLIIKHFTQAQDVISFLNQVGLDKQHILLLTDYELLKQNLNGLDVIAKTQIERSILVTSHYNNSKVRQQANFSNTRILPKLLASFIPIKVFKNVNQSY